MDYGTINGKLDNGTTHHEYADHRQVVEELRCLRKMVEELAARVSHLEEVIQSDVHRVPQGVVYQGNSENGHGEIDGATTFTSSAVFTPSHSVPQLGSPARDAYSLDGRSSCVSSSDGSPPLPPNSVGDFFASGGMSNGLFSGVPDYQSDKMQELLRDPLVVSTLMNQMQRYNAMVPDISPPRANSVQGVAYFPQMPPGLRRTNSNRNRRSRRYSLPDSRNQWAPPPTQSRHGSFIGLPSDMCEELGPDDAFSDVINQRSNADMKELEILCRFGEIGVGKGQMNAPHGFCLGKDEEIIVADTNNHRIQIFDKNGNPLRYWGKAGKRDGHLWHPRKVAYMPPAYLTDIGRIVVCDRGHDRSRLQIFSYNGDFEQNIAIDFVAIVAGMTVCKNKIVIVDSVNPTCLVLDPDMGGKMTFWFDCSKYMKEPSDVVVDRHRQWFLICDFKGHCVVVFNGRGEFVKRIGDDKVISFPNGIDITNQGQIMVGDSHGNRFHVAMYSPEGQFLAEYECPHMKVSRCCGLVLTSENHIVTIAKNNNFILILDRMDAPNGIHARALLEADAEQQETEF